MTAFALAPRRLFDGERLLEAHTVVVDAGRVTSLASGTPAGLQPRRLDGLLAPGFVDVQVNGGGGVLLNDEPSVAGIETIAAAHRRFGTTSLLPTLVSDSFEVMTCAARAAAGAIATGVPGVRGIHFEGPYLNPERRGVHDARAIRPPDEAALDLLTVRAPGRVVVTLAPECVRPDFIAALAAAGVRVCAGHTAATYAEARAGVAAGITGFTHLFNAMSPLVGREPGAVGAALDDDATWCSVIADGHHVHDASLRVAIAAKPRGKVMLVTDAMPGVGACDKRFRLGGDEIVVRDGLCVTADGVLAGSDLDMAGAVRNAVRRLGLPLEEALRMASLYPAEFLGIEGEVGRIAPGHAADLVLLDDDLVVTETWVAGRALRSPDPRPRAA